MVRVLFYHFTSTHHLPRILDAGFLKTVESNISRNREHAGPDVVWLLATPELGSHGHGLENSAVDKTAIRFTVDVDKRQVRPWREWALSRGINQDWMRTLAGAGGSGAWRVIERPIPREEWVSILDVARGQEIRW